MLGAQELGDPFIGPVVDQHRAEQRLLGLEVVRRLAMRERFGAGEQGDAGLGFWHDWRTVGRGCGSNWIITDTPAGGGPPRVGRENHGGESASRLWIVGGGRQPACRRGATACGECGPARSDEYTSDHQSPMRN